MRSYELEELKRLFLLELSKSPRCVSKRLNEAISYALKGEGKRLRPLLVLATALSSAKKEQPEQVLKRAMPAALAVEYVHTYSLIHDDLPSMDDDDYRRGRLSLHRRFDEALAILAGDALLADAFLFTAQAPLKAAEQCAELSLASGRHGIVAGQVEDLAAADLSQDAWFRIHAHKTARLFEACTALGALSQGLPEQELKNYRKLGHHFGMAFQLKDDIDDKAGLFLHCDAPARDKLWRFHEAELDGLIDTIPAHSLIRELVHRALRH